MAESRKDVLVVIPARWAAQRFPGKPLTAIDGKPMIQRVWEAAAQSKRATRVVIATDDTRISKAAKRFGASVCMTSPKCPSGTDRVAQAAKASKAGIIVNVQGDEPLMTSQTIDKVIEALQQDDTAIMSTAVRRSENDKEWKSPNSVKAVLDRMNYALYFSRAPIPAVRSAEDAHRSPKWIHLGIYAFRRPFLFRFAALAPTTLELTEKLEQLRVLEHGCSIKVVIAKEMSAAVDTPQDVKRVEKILKASLKRAEEAL